MAAASAAMLVLLAFGFVAGAATALSPCVLPVLPVALSAGATGGRRRPLGVVAGLVATFTFATVALVYVISALGLPDDLLRDIAIAVLLGFGLALLVPRVAARVEVAFARLLPRRVTGASGDGFWSGAALGGSLGLVYAPCAGPILAGVITVSASQAFTADRLAVAAAYALGSGVVLYALMLGGRRVTSRWARRSGRVQAAMGAVMVVVAVLMAFELDIRFQTSLADNLPAVVVNPTGALERSDAVDDRLAELHDGPAAFAAAPRRRGALPVLGAAPELRGTQQWFNTPGGAALSLESLRGRVVLIDFWTYSCINCIRTLPHIRAWDARYRRAGLTVIGVHAPEFPFERDPHNVARAIRANELRYPVVQDNEFATWRAYGNRYWPAKYLVDARGRVRYTHFGEGDYEETEGAIRSLLGEAGRDRLGPHVRVSSDGGASGPATPESYLGAERAERFVNGPLVPGTQRFTLGAATPQAIPPHHLAFEGRWTVGRSRAVAAGPDSRLHLHFVARDVHLVLGHRDGNGRVEVRLDGRHVRTLRIRAHELYDLVELPRSGDHLLTLRASRGTEAYAFTFG